MDLVKTNARSWLPMFRLVLCKVLRHIFVRSPVGVKTVTKIFGGRNRNGVIPSYLCRSSDSIAGKGLQALESQKLIEKIPDGGRILECSGQMLPSQIRRTSASQGTTGRLAECDCPVNL